MTPLANVGKARTRRAIPDIDQHLQAQVVRALNKADTHFRHAMAFVNNKSSQNKLKHHISRGNLYLQTGRNMANTLHLINLKNRALAINKKAAHLRPRRYS